MCTLKPLCEQANPTSYPLPNEEQAAHLHGQSEQIKLTSDAEPGSALYLFRKGGDPIAPAHYNDTAITPFQVIDAWGLDFYLGNVVKYLCRREKKGSQLADLHKAATYLAEKIKQLEAAE